MDKNPVKTERFARPLAEREEPWLMVQPMRYFLCLVLVLSQSLPVEACSEALEIVSTRTSWVFHIENVTIAIRDPLDQIAKAQLSNSEISTMADAAFEAWRLHHSLQGTEIHIEIVDTFVDSQGQPADHMAAYFADERMSRVALPRALMATTSKSLSLALVLSHEATHAAQHARGEIMHHSDDVENYEDHPQEQEAWLTSSIVLKRMFPKLKGYLSSGRRQYPFPEHVTEKVVTR